MTYVLCNKLCLMTIFAMNPPLHGSCHQRLIAELRSIVGKVHNTTNSSQPFLGNSTIFIYGVDHMIYKHQFTVLIPSHEY